MKILSLLFLAPLAFLLTSCLESSTVVKVKKDGSGLVHIRVYKQTATSEDDVELPTEESVQELAAKMGPDVKVSSVKKAHNPKGWYGYEVIFEYPDINQVQIFFDKAKEGDKEKPDDKKTGMNMMTLSFVMKDGILEATMDDPEWNRKAAVAKVKDDSPTIDPYAGTSGPPAQSAISAAAIGNNEQMIKAMTKGMRYGVFIQPADPIKSTNALYQNGELITVVNFDMEKLYKDGSFDYEVLNNSKSREELSELAKSFDGVEIDLQKPMRIEFK